MILMWKTRKIDKKKLEDIKNYTQRYYSLYDLFGDLGLDRGGKKLHCPFHNEKIPSFNIDFESNNFHCFSCNAGGGYLNFLYEYETKVLKNNRSYYQFIENILKKDNQMRHTLGFDSIYIELTQTASLREILENPIKEYTPKVVNIDSFVTEERKITDIELLLDYYSSLEKGDTLEEIQNYNNRIKDDAVKATSLFDALFSEEDEED